VSVFFAFSDGDRTPRKYGTVSDTIFLTARNNKTSELRRPEPNRLLFRLIKGGGLRSSRERRSALGVDRRQSVGPCSGDRIRKHIQLCGVFYHWSAWEIQMTFARGQPFFFFIFYIFISSEAAKIVHKMYIVG
jgi:hypothetical protein